MVVRSAQSVVRSNRTPTIRRRLGTVLSVVALAAAPAATSAAVITFDDGSPHDINDATHAADMLVLQDGPGAAPDVTTLNVQAGAEINTPPTDQDNSIGVHAQENSAVNVSGGQIGARGGTSMALAAVGQSVIDVTGGALSSIGIGSSGLALADTATATISNGTISADGFSVGALTLRGDSHVEMTGGTISTTGDSGDAVRIFDTASINISGGSLTGSGTFGGTGLEVSSGNATVTGGTIAGGAGSLSQGIDAIFTADVSIEGGTVTGNTAVNSSFNSSIEITGGMITGDSYGVQTSLSGQANIRGGQISGSLFDIRAINTSVIRIFGTDFDRPLGTISDLSGSVSGTLRDGTPFTYSFERFHSSATIRLIPTPATAMILLPSLLALAGSRSVRTKCRG